MNLKTKTLLEVAVLDRANYDTMKGRQQLRFLEHEIEDHGRADRFSEVHALALLVFNTLRRLGLSAGVACEAVYDGWSDIRAVVVGEPPANDRCGVRIFARVIFHETLGNPSIGAPFGAPMGEASVPLRQAWDYCRARLAEIDGLPK